MSSPPDRRCVDTPYLLSVDRLTSARCGRPGLPLGAASALPLFLLAGCQRGVLDPKGPIAAAEKTVLFNSLAIMLAIVIPVIVATLLFAWWFRAANTRAVYRPTFIYNGQIEMVVWSVPAMVVLLLAGVVWVSTHQLDPPRPIESTTAAVQVEVISLDWKWLFIYPDLGVASVNRLVVPVGTPIAFRLTSATVMNSFFVPQLGSQIYSMAGMATRLHLQADEPGRYRGMSAQISGDGFADMGFEVIARPPAEFARWLAEVRRGDGPALDASAYAALTRPSERVPPSDYRAVAPGLFDRVMAMSAEPAAASEPIGHGGAMQVPPPMPMPMPMPMPGPVTAPIAKPPSDPPKPPPSMPDMPPTSLPTAAPPAR